MIRWTWIWLSVAMGAPGVLPAQADTATRRHDGTLPAVRDVGQRATVRRAVVHHGKWLTAGAAVGLTVMAAHEHGRSRREWNQLLAICRSADDACARGPDGRYARADAEALYQRSLAYDRRANHRLLGAQASLLVTAALFILDLHPGRDEPDNIPFAPFRVTAEAWGDGARVGLRFAF